MKSFKSWLVDFGLEGIVLQKIVTRRELKMILVCICENDIDHLA